MEQPEPFPILETNRLVLREMTLNDLEFYFRHFNNEKIVEGCCFPGPENLETARKELELYCIRPYPESRGIRWGIVTKEENELIGTCGFYDWNKKARRAEIGGDLEPAYWGRGIMTEALHVVLDFGFVKMNLNRIQAIIDAQNLRSMTLMLRLGFQKEGVLRQRSYFKGDFRDDVIFSLLKREWRTSSDLIPLI